MKSPELTVLIYTKKRVLRLTDEAMSLEIEIPQGLRNALAKMTFIDLDNASFKPVSSEVKIGDLERFVSGAKFQFIHELKEFCPLNTPMGGQFRLDKTEIEFLDLLLNEPDDECLDNMLMKKNPTSTFTPK